jgi:hypothetical protein
MTTRSDNLPFAFRGEKLPPPRLLNKTEARAMLDARNPTGKPNADVVRGTIGVDPTRRIRRGWMLDFPAEMSAAEAALFVEPFRLLRQRGLRPGNPSRNAELRNALARLDRYLAMPVSAPEPVFDWMEGELLPDDSLLVWARDDDFSAGVLASRVFELWWQQAPGIVALQTFPFPWPPATPLSSLTRDQEEHRHALARATRAGNEEATNTAVLRAYELTDDANVEQILTRLRAK